MKTITNKWTGKVIYKYEPSLASAQLKRLVEYVKELEKPPDEYIDGKPYWNIGGFREDRK